MRQAGFAFSVVALAGLGAIPGIAQEGGLTVNAGLSETLHWNDEEGVRLRTDLSFGVTSATRTQTLALDATGRLDLGEEGLSADDYGLDLSYGRRAANAELLAELGLQRTDISSAFFVVSDDFTAVDLVSDSGTRTDLAAALSLRTGLRSPFGLDLDLTTRQTRYDGTSDPDLFDIDRRGADVSARFELDPRITLRAGLGYSETDTGGEGTDRETLSVSAGTVLAVSPRLTVAADLIWDETLLQDSGGESRQEGLGATLQADWALPAGSLSATLANRVEANGRRTRAEVTRTFELPTGALSLTFGLVGDEESGLTGLFGASYSQELTPTLAFDASLDQEIVLDADADDIRRTQAAARVSYQATPTARISAGLELFDVDALDGGEDSRRIAATASYAQALTADWDLTSGVSLVRTESDDEGSEQTRDIFIGITRDIAWRP